MSIQKYKIVVYELHPETLKLRKVVEYTRDPKTMDCFTRAGAVGFRLESRFRHPKYEAYVEPVSAKACADSARSRQKKPVCVRRWKKTYPWMTRTEALRMCKGVGMPLRFGHVKKVRDSVSFDPGLEFMINVDGRWVRLSPSNAAKVRAAWPDGSRIVVRMYVYTGDGFYRESSLIGAAAERAFEGVDATKVWEIVQASDFMRSARTRSKSHKSHKLRRVGVSRKCRKCDKCGKTGLKQTYVMERSDGTRFHYGSECARP